MPTDNPQSILRNLIHLAGGSLFVPGGFTVEADFLGTEEPFTTHRVFIENGTDPHHGDICLGYNGGIPVILQDISDSDIKDLIGHIQKHSPALCKR